MSKIVPGRYTAQMEGPFAVFAIGMRVNRLWAVHKWLPVFMAMGPMIKELYTHKELGFYHTEFFVSWRRVTLLQYWRSFEDIERYARGGLHLKAWKDFNRKIGNDGTVGIFHESYLIDPGKYESVYVNMPAIGLGKAGKHIPATGKREAARSRLEAHGKV